MTCMPGNNNIKSAKTGPKNTDPPVALGAILMSTRILFTLIAFLVAGCTAKEAKLTPQEDAVIASVGMERSVALDIKRFGVSIHRLTGINPDHNEIQANGILLQTKPKSGRTALAKIRGCLAGTPYRAYLNDDSFGYGPDKIAVLKSDDYAYLAIIRTDGINYDLEHPQVMARYRLWNERYGLKLVGAGQDWLEAEFVNPPKDMQSFAEEVYKFCPDVVDQGTGDVQSLAREMASSKSVYLWWD